MTAPLMVRCDIGGDYQYVYRTLSGPAVAEYQEPCMQPPVARWRPKDGAGVAEGHWNHRCAEHVGWLDASRVDVEPLAGAS